MANGKFMEYVNEQRRIGKSNKQIATSLGMSLKHFLSQVGKATDIKEEKPKEMPKVQAKAKEVTKAPDKKPTNEKTKPDKDSEEPVVVLETKPEDDFDWMD